MKPMRAAGLAALTVAAFLAVAAAHSLITAYHAAAAPRVLGAWLVKSAECDAIVLSVCSPRLVVAEVLVNGSLVARVPIYTPSSNPPCDRLYATLVPTSNGWYVNIVEARGPLDALRRVCRCAAHYGDPLRLYGATVEVRVGDWRWADALTLTPKVSHR